VTIEDSGTDVGPLDWSAMATTVGASGAPVTTNGAGAVGRGSRPVRRLMGPFVGHRRATVVILVLILAGVSVGVGLTLSGTSGAQFRTTVAALGTVQQTISATGTIEPVDQANVSFVTAGAVASVNVTAGQTVTAGQVVATLVSTPLSIQMEQDQASLATAQAKLQSDESPTASTLASAQSSVTSAQNSLTNDETSLTDAATTNQMSLTQSQQGLQTAQTTLAGDQTTLENDQSTLIAAQAKEAVDCQGDVLGSSASDACATDESQVTSDQSKVTSDQSKVTSDQSALVSDQDTVSSTQLKNAQTMQQDQQQVTSAQAQLATAQASLQTTEAGATPAQLESDQANVAAAQATLTTAQNNLNGAKLVAPIAGTVTAVNIVAGGSVSAGNTTIGAPTASTSSSTSASTGTGTGTGTGSSSAAVIIVSPGTFEVQGTVSDTQVAEIKDGDQAVVTPSGAATNVYGTIASVGVVATVSSGVATFPVVVAVTGTPSGLYAGSSADVSIVVLQRTGVLSVPSSAVHTIGTSSFVYELQGGREVAHTVSVGAVGGTLTQITKGLKAGQAIVLASLSAITPSGTTTGRTGFGGLGGGLGGGGLTGGGGFGGRFTDGGGLGGGG
jgi:multidrug efflux pump subunit AcrA (membrane-fusion protein)